MTKNIEMTLNMKATSHVKTVKEDPAVYWSFLDGFFIILTSMYQHQQNNLKPI